VTDPVRSLVVGIGSPFGDDQVGWLVVNHIAQVVDQIAASRMSPRPAALDSAAINVRCARVPLDLLDWLDDVSCLHVVDACCSDHSTAHLERLVWNSADSTASTANQFTNLDFRQPAGHDFGITDVLRLAESTGRIPPNVVLWAITGSQFAPDSCVSGAISTAVESLAEQIMRDLSMFAKNQS
jgi:hydrogenase maturation protease